MSIKQSLLPVLAFIGACALSVSATGADTPEQAGPDVASADSAGKPPFIVRNSDATFTIQKEPRKGNSKVAKAQKGLEIPPQVVVPIIPTQKR
jgi:hypothetical protein